MPETMGLLVGEAAGLHQRLLYPVVDVPYCPPQAPGPLKSLTFLFSAINVEAAHSDWVFPVLPPVAHACVARHGWPKPVPSSWTRCERQGPGRASGRLSSPTFFQSRLCPQLLHALSKLG
jgi:hypothetical protein